ncbi:PAS domain S-box protein [Candidatus Deferrimicrobium sp.]|uniref:PAS domain S-box protein n=1 Tax=Candidatus Deferrimicrobium sp. TaxID=3060586 RepID=UPI002ED131E2
MVLPAIKCVSAILQFIAVWQSVAFLSTGRLGRVWSIVSLALFLNGLLLVWEIISSPWSMVSSITDQPVVIAEFFISLLLASGFLLTGQWFRFRERLEARFELITEVERSLAGVLEEKKILSLVCGILSNARGYRLVWVGAAEADGTIRVECSAGDAAEFLRRVTLRWDDAPSRQAPPGNALRTGGTITAREGVDGLPTEWREGCRRHGLVCCAAARIEQHGFPHKVLVVHADTATSFDRVETEALAAMARTVGSAIQGARRHECFVNAKESYDELLRNQRDGVILVREGRVVRANPAAAEMLGYASPGLLFDADPSSILAEPDAVAGLRDALRGPGMGETRSEWEASLVRMDGSTFPGEIRLTWTPREDRNDTFIPKRFGPLGMIVLRDATERVRVLRELRKERDFSNRMLDISGALVLQVSRAGEILLFNRQCEEVTGIAARDAMGKKMWDVLIPEPARDLHRDAIRGVVSGRTSPPLETAVVTAHASPRTIAWNHVPLHDGAGTIVSVIVTGIDVTERRLLEKQLIEMQKMEAVGTLAGGIAHDFNNILTGILGSLDLAREFVPPGSPASVPIAEGIKASERAVQLVRQLLDFSRRAPAECRPVDLGNVVREVATLFSQTIDRRIDVTYSIADDLLPAFVDPNQVHQVLMNLCVNARDAILESLETDEKSGGRPLTGYWIYTRAENVEVDDDYCRIFPYARRGRYIRLSIGDNGAGMDEATQRRVFEPFFTTKKMGRGTGLGLSTVYGIIKQHNGWINLESRAGKGTTFCVYFPEATGLSEEAPALPEIAPSKRGKETVLFADDEELIRDLGRQVMEMHGYTVFLAEDGMRAIDLFRANREAIDLVVLDLSMPQRSGMEVIREIRKIDPGARIILSSGSPPSEPVPGTTFLSKPYRADTLAKVIRTALDAPRPA